MPQQDFHAEMAASIILSTNNCFKPKKIRTRSQNDRIEKSDSSHGPLQSLRSKLVLRKHDEAKTRKSGQIKVKPATIFGVGAHHHLPTISKNPKYQVMAVYYN